MSQKLIKELGREEKCPSCQAKIKCGQTEYQGETKLQWQNADGKAHYKFDATTKKTSCNSTMQGESGLKDQSLLQNWSEERIITQVNKIHTIEKLVKTELSKLDTNIPLEEKVRFYTKLLYR